MTAVPVLDLKAQYQSIKDEIDEAVLGVMTSGHFVLGPNVKALETEVAEYVGCQCGVGVASGTDALRLSLAALDMVIRPDLSPEGCAALLTYRNRDFADLQSCPISFFGATLECGDLALEVWPLPRVPVAIALWQGDGEVADGGTLLLDTTATHYLPNLLAELAALTLWRLKNILDPEIKWGYHELGRQS